MTDRSVAAGSMSGDEIVALARRYTMFDWQAQAATNPIPVDRAEGVYFWTPEGRRYLDFNSQLMGVNIGHGDRRVVEAIKRQAERLPYVSPFMATEARARLGQKLAGVLPGDIAKVFFTLGGAEANDNAIRVARRSPGARRSWRGTARITAPPAGPSA
jgi:taurine---2-oxoglutarate transaminase